MSLVLLIPVLISLLLLAAHLLRWVGPGGAVGALAVALLLAVPRAWAARLMQIALILATLEWVRTGVSAIAHRHAAGQPWLRMAIIVGAVTLFTALSALVFLARPLRRRYRLPMAVGEAPKT
jgi:hypothetical protein